jgi:Mg2+ and Co2+ transporter CorA
MLTIQARHTIDTNLLPAVENHDNHDVESYYALMMDNIDEVTDKRMEALEEIEKDKRRIARAYNKKVKNQIFSGR